MFLTVSYLLGIKDIIVIIITIIMILMIIAINTNKNSNLKYLKRRWSCVYVQLVLVLGRVKDED